jgi:hypothetical protein
VVPSIGGGKNHHRHQWPGGGNVSRRRPRPEAAKHHLGEGGTHVVEHSTGERRPWTMAIEGLRRRSTNEHVDFSGGVFFPFPLYSAQRLSCISLSRADVPGVLPPTWPGASPPPAPVRSPRGSNRDRVCIQATETTILRWVGPDERWWWERENRLPCNRLPSAVVIAHRPTGAGPTWRGRQPTTEDLNGGECGS